MPRPQVEPCIEGGSPALIPDAVRLASHRRRVPALAACRRIGCGLALALLLAVAPARAADDLPEPTPTVATMGLDDALARFRAESPTAEQLAGRVMEARAQVRLAASQLQPILAARGSYTRNRDDAIFSLSDMLGQLIDLLPNNVEIDPSIIPDDFIIQPQEQWTGAGSLQVPLVDARAWADWSAAKKAAEATEAGVEAARLQVEGGVVKAAWLASAAAESVEANRKGVEAARSHRDSAQRRMDAGIGTELDVLQADTELVRRQSDYVQAVADLDKARRGLGALLGLDGPVEVTVPALDMVQPAAGDEDLSRHPTMISAEAATLAASRQVTSALLRQLPTLSGSARYFLSDVEYVTGEKDGWQLGLELTWVLYDGGARYGLLDRARGQRQQADARARQAALDLARDVAEADHAVDVARQRLRLADTAVATATEADATATRLYEAGLVSSLDVLDAQQRLTDLELAHAGARAQLAAALADQVAARGRSWDDR